MITYGVTPRELLKQLGIKLTPEEYRTAKGVQLTVEEDRPTTVDFYHANGGPSVRMTLQPEGWR